ncbi:hypothetical protein [Thermoleptolyngbya sp. PKUAC-SCTB121]|uniref:hypothetical protein n=1 Tax=Thermoleptolyngbya sp. PKUAC-SCTB121 TaxID=2811482 RepID=UPI00196439AB|nr:hypothetical protein [Thermoleptolyngbya sp. PKUAC-SCTB121]
MTHSPASNFSPFPVPVQRRHRDPSGLWSRVCSGSVVLHILLLLAVLPSLKTAVERSRGGGAATPIELIDVGAIAPDTTPDPATVPASPVAPAPAEVSAPPPAATPAPPPLPVAPLPAPAAIPPAVLAPVPVETPPPSPIAPPPVVSPPTPIPTPAPIPTPTPPPQPPSPAPVQPSPFVPPEPPPVLGREPLPPPRPFPDAGSPSESTEPPFPTPGQTPIGGGNPVNNPGDVAANPAPGSGAPSIDTPASGPDSGTGDDLGEVVIGRQPTPTSLTLSVAAVRYLSPQDTADIPEDNAELLTSRISVLADPTQPNSCPLFPDSVVGFGAPVTLRLAVEADGRVSRAEVQQPAPTNYAYTELVQCLAQTGLQFRPALDSGIARPSDNTLVEVTVVGE